MPRIGDLDIQSPQKTLSSFRHHFLAALDHPLWWIAILEGLRLKIKDIMGLGRNLTKEADVRTIFFTIACTDC